MRRWLHSPAEVANRAAHELLTPKEVALVLGVDPKTLARWDRQGRIHTQWTLGGRRRLSVAEVIRCLNEMETSGAPKRDRPPDGR